MFKKIILSIVLACSFATSATRMDAEGLNGSFEIKYNHDSDSSSETTYRTRLGWNGTVNSMTKWGVALSSEIESPFDNNIGLTNITLEQAWLTYSPVSNFRITVGKTELFYDPNVFGILYTEDYYAQGVLARYMHRINRGTTGYLIASHTGFGSDFISRATVGVKNRIKSMRAHVGFGVESTDATNVTENGYSRGFVSLGTRQMGLPTGVFGTYSTALSDMFSTHSYTAGVWIDGTGAQDFSVNLSYYNVNAESWHVSLLDSDYVDGAGEGVALRGRYRLMNNVNIVGKVRHDLANSSQRMVAEVTATF